MLCSILSILGVSIFSSIWQFYVFVLPTSSHPILYDLVYKFVTEVKFLISYSWSGHGGEDLVFYLEKLYYFNAFDQIFLVSFGGVFNVF